MSGEQEPDALEVLLRRAAREHLGLADGDHWPSSVSTSQATAILASDWLADHNRRVRASALREAASNYLHTYPEVYDELRDRADRIEGER